MFVQRGVITDLYILLDVTYENILNTKYTKIYYYHRE